MANCGRSQSSSTSVNIEAELSNDCLPDVVWAKLEMQVLLIGSDDAFEETVGIWYDHACGTVVKTFEGAVHDASAWNHSTTASCEGGVRLLHLLTAVKQIPTGRPCRC